VPRWFKPEGWPSFRELLEIAESAHPSGAPFVNDYSDVELPARDGWKVVFTYRGGGSHYISEFIRPDGATFDPWDQANDLVSGEKWSPLCNWQGVGDLRRLDDAGVIAIADATDMPRISVEHYDGFSVANVTMPIVHVPFTSRAK